MSVIVLARIALETLSPLAIYSGSRDLLSNNALARDWNGNPYLPATTVAGVWRSAIGDFNLTSINPLKSTSWFGRKGAGRKETDRLASRVTVYDGLLLDSHSRLPGDEREGELRILCEKEDVIYRSLCTSEDRRYERPGCRINAKKTNHNGSLFKSKTLPKGVRFAFDVKFELDSDNDVSECRRLLSFISSDSFTMGSKTANGLGTFKVIGMTIESLDLEKFSSDSAALAEKIRKFVTSREVGIGNLADCSCVQNSDEKVWDFVLESHGSMRIGTGRASEKLTVSGSDGRAIGSMKCDDGVNVKNRNIQQCFTDSRFDWNGKEFVGQINEFIIPGSTIKGILAHRTMYHFLRRRNWFADKAIKEGSEVRPQELVEKILNNETPPIELEPYYSLFGRNDPKDHSNMLSGALKVSDAVVNCAGVVNRMHNKIDRFTGAVMPSALFGQARLVDPNFKITIRIDPSRRCQLKDDCEIMQAFEDTIYDLKHGFLSICAGSGRDTAVFFERV